MCGYEQFLKLARKRRTSRGYVDSPVPDEAIWSILEAARWSPSAANTQPWEFIVIRDMKVKKALQKAFLNEALDHEDRRYRKVSEQQAGLLLETVLIGVCGKPASSDRYVNSKELTRTSQDELYLLSMGAMIQNMLLAATALELNSTWIARLARIPEVSVIMGIPEQLELVAFVTIGLTSQKLTVSEGRRIPVSKKVHLNRYGEAWS